MAGSISALVTKVINLFRWSEEEVPDTENENNPHAEEESSIIARWNKKRAEDWDKIRDMALRGNAAGAIATLTAIGSGRLVPSQAAPQKLLLWTLMSFLLGLLLLLFQRFLAVTSVTHEETREVNFLYGSITRPPGIYQKLFQIFDVLAVYFLLIGAIFGILTLYLMLYR